MEFKIQREPLLEGLFLAQSATEHKTTMPILANVLVGAKGKTITFTATDLQVGIISRQQADVVSEGSLLIPAKNFFDIAKELQGGIVKVKAQSNNWVEITCGQSRFKIMGAAPDDFPNLPVSEGNEFNFDAKAFSEMVNKVSYAMSNDETRHSLNGVFLEQTSRGNKPCLRMVATDGHRLSYSEQLIPDTFNLPKGVILPKKAVWEISKVLKDVEGEFKIQIGEKTVSISAKNANFICRLVDGQFPPYLQVIPKECSRVVSIDRQQFMHSLRCVMLVASDKSKGVKFAISPGNLDISSSNPDVGEAKEELTCVYKGETFEIGFNASYFLDILNVLEDEKVVLELKNDMSPCVIRSEFDKGFLSVVMPMRI